MANLQILCFPLTKKLALFGFLGPLQLLHNIFTGKTDHFVIPSTDLKLISLNIKSCLVSNYKNRMHEWRIFLHLLLIMHHVINFHGLLLGFLGT